MPSDTVERDEWNWQLHDSIWDLVELVPAGLATCSLTRQYPQESADYLPASGSATSWYEHATHAALSFAAVSFLHRRADRDKDQTGILAMCACCGALIGLLQKASYEHIMSVYMSWAVCATMMLSVVNYHCRVAAKPTKPAAYG